MPKISKENALLSESAIYLVSNIINAAIPFMLLPVLTRYLAPSEYGELAMFQILLGALGAFVGLNVAGAAGRQYYDLPNSATEMKSYIGSCLQIVLASAFFIFLLIFIFEETISNLLSIKPTWILLSVYVTATTVIINIRLVQWQVRKQARIYGIFQISQSALNAIISTILVVALLRGADGRIEAICWVSGLFAIISLLMLHRDKLLGLFEWHPNYIREALEFGVPIIPHIAGAFLLLSVDRFIIKSELGLAAAGIYMLAVQFSMAMTIVFDAVNKAYMPWLFIRLSRDRLDEKIKIVHYTYAWFFLICIAVGFAFLLGPWLIVSVAGESYAKAGEIIGWLALGQGFNGMYFMVTNYIFFSKRTGLLSIVTFTSGFLNIFLLILFIRLFDLKGAAVAFSISMGIRFLFTWWAAQKRHPMPWFYFNFKNS